MGALPPSPSKGYQPGRGSVAALPAPAPPEQIALAPTPLAVRHEAGLQAGPAPQGTREGEEMAEAIERDEVGAKLRDYGLCTAYSLQSDHTHIGLRDSATLPQPWNLPSRLMQFPVSMAAPIDGRPRRLGVRHALLAQHPFVQQIEQALGFQLEPCGIPNRYGIRNDHGQWHHAVDLVCAYQWRQLIETRDLTTDDSIAGAVGFGLDHSDYRSSRKGYLTTTEARAIMAAIGEDEPTDATALLRIFAAPVLSSQGENKKGWPINTRFDAGSSPRAWGRIIGIEYGWFDYDRAGFLQWAETGRARYAAGDATTYTEASGQAAFAF